tara:strand:+ start:7614 stop:8645 length:1032 start_codon:yes stop_codon:yes gene_type:complete
MEGNSIDNNCFCLEKDCTKIDESLSDLERREFFSGNNISDSDSDSDSDNNDEINVHINEYPIENTSNEHIKSTDKAFVEQKSMLQIIDESKLKTEQELIKLGQQLKEKEQKENNLKTNLTKSKDILSKYKDKDSIQIVDEFIKNKKYIELKELIDVLMNHESIVNEILVEKDKKIEKLDTQLDESIQDNKDLMQENNDLEDKIEKYWEPRVSKLRGMLIERKQYLKYYHIGYITIIFHTFILTKYGFYSYFNFWCGLFDILYRIIYFLVFLLPNTYHVLTNQNTYINISNNVLDVTKYCLNYTYVNTFDKLSKIKYIIFDNNMTVGLLFFTLLFIKVINKYVN